MTNNNLFTDNNIDHKYLNKNILDKFSKEFKKIIKEIQNDINNPKKTLNVLNRKFNINLNIKELKKFKIFKTIVIIGMGGSILGSEAIHNFLESKIRKKVHFFNSLDEEKILRLKKKQNLNKALFLVISKSGNTIETLTNLFSLKIIKKNSKNIIIISEKKNNLLYSLSKKYNLYHIEHNTSIGGRYSVLTEVGIIPAHLMGVSTNKLRLYIQNFLTGREKKFLKNSVIKLSSLLNSKKINNLIFLNYSPKLEKFLFWCQQLIAESLGKKGKGFLPMISNVPKDHHSLLQLYLDGPRDKLFHIFSLEEKSKNKLKIKKITNENNPLNNKTFDNIKMAQKNALIKTFKKNKIPFREFKIKSVQEQVLGKLFSYFILETVIIGKLVNINPFDQPAVEEVKRYTKKLLN